MNAPRCAIIGGGLGGLAAAVSLAAEGYQVHLYEKNRQTGGKAGTLRADGFRFDTGPSLLTMPHVLEGLFRRAGADMHKYIRLVKLDRHCTYFYPDGTVLEVGNDATGFEEEVVQNTTDNAETVRKYFNYCKTIYDLTADLFLYNDFHEASTFIKHGKMSMLFKPHKMDFFRTVHGANRSFFSDPRMVQLFDRYTTYNGSDPYQAPATLNIIPHVEFNPGVYVPEGGIYIIPRALTRLAASMGVTINTSTPVEKILNDGKRINGIRVRGEDLSYDVVVSNVDVQYTYSRLLDDQESRDAKRYRKLEPSSSAVIFYWGVKDIHDRLGVHSILFSNDYRKEFADLFSEKRCPDDPTVYLYISSRYNESDAPAGHENWFVMINAPYDDGQNWEEETQLSRERVIRKINRMLGIDVRQQLVYEKMVSPVDIRDNTASTRGSIYGISSNSPGAAFWRQSIRSRRYRGLYFCGGSAHPGGGMPLVLLSGMTASDLVKKFGSG